MSKRLNNMVLKWQRILNLDHWRIQVIHEHRLPKNVRGRCYWEGKMQDATILINANYDWETYPIEKTIIHELLHLHFAALGDPCPNCIEDAVTNLTKTIFRLFQLS